MQIKGELQFTTRTQEKGYWKLQEFTMFDSPKPVLKLGGQHCCFCILRSHTLLLSVPRKTDLLQNTRMSHAAVGRAVGVCVFSNCLEFQMLPFQADNSNWDANWSQRSVSLGSIAHDPEVL